MAAPGTDPREPLGRIVHETRVTLNAELERPFNLGEWEDRPAHQKELDMRMGEAVAAAVRDCSRVTRFEVINHAGSAEVHTFPGFGRAVVAYGIQVELSLQDQGRTLKVFLDDRGGGGEPAEPEHDRLLAAENTIGQVLRYAGMLKVQRGDVRSSAVGDWLLDMLRPWTGQEGDLP